MFSTMPRIGASSCWNIRTARTASSSATCCGVATITAPANGSSWHSVSGTSPVPGGRSTMR